MEQGNIANQGEAEKCRDLAKNFLSKGEYAKAVKFFDKSLRLYPLPGVKALKEKAERLSKGGPAPSSSSAKSNASTTSSAGNSTSPVKEHTRAYTPEQESGSKKILALSKKSHYEVLGVSKDATADQIKKAYRKMALKYHPDKNSAPSAEGAFKAISTAFDTLTDPSKRELYDQVGHDQAETMQQTGQTGDPFAAFRGRGGMHAGMHEVSPEEPFNMFFQGAGGHGFRAQFGRGGFRRRPQRRQQEAYHDDHDTQHQGGNDANFLQQLFQLLPILLMIIMSFSSFGSTSYNQPVFSFARSGVYQAQKTTHLPGVSPDIPFYVDASFDKSYNKFSDKYRKIEKEVEVEYKHLLSRKCGQEKALKNNRMYQARFSGQEARKKAEQMPLPSCDELKSRFFDKFHS